MPHNSESKVAVITGGATGIGRAVASQLAARGVTVVIAGRSAERGGAAETELNRGAATVKFVRADVGIEKDVRNLVDDTMRSFGRIDYVFNNAGTEGVLGPLEDNTEAIIDEVLASNIKGVLLCTKHMAPALAKQKSGVIINTASFVGTTMPFPAAVTYGATKAAVISITQSTAAAMAEHGVQVFAVCPWMTDTAMADRLTGHQAEAKAAFGANINPSGKIATPDDIAGVVVNLFVGQEAFRSGQAILVDQGGATSTIVPMSIAQ